MRWAASWRWSGRPWTFGDPEAFAATLAELSRAVMDAGGAETSQVEYVGVGLPGAVSGGDVVYTTNIPMENVPLEALFRHTLDLPLLLGNDADCAAVGEFFCGAGQGQGLRGGDAGHRHRRPASSWMESSGAVLPPARRDTW